MDRNLRKIAPLAFAAPLALLLAGCPIEETVDVGNDATEAGVDSSEHGVLEAREGYRLSLVGLEVQESEGDEGATDADSGRLASAEGVAVARAAGETMIGAAEAEEAEGEGEEGEEGEEVESAEGPRPTEVMLDLVVRFVGPGEPLPGITVEVSQEDAFGQLRQRHLVWAETPGLRRGEKRQVPLRLEVDDYEDGDEFYVEWQAFVPPEERGRYREFAEAE